MLMLNTTGCGSIAKGIGKAIVVGMAVAVVDAALRAPSHHHRSLEQPQGQPQVDEAPPPPPKTACQRRLQRWMEIEQAVPPPELRCGPDGREPSSNMGYAAPM